jgi:hypothetical protein
MPSEQEIKQVDQSANPVELVADEGRREAMIRLAKYTAPVMLAVLLSEKAVAASTPP